MIDLYLKAETKAALHEFLLARGFERAEESEHIHHQRVLLDEIGAIHAPTGAMMTDDQGNEWPEIAPVPGYHANLRVLDDALAVEFAEMALDPAPATPARVWA